MKTKFVVHIILPAVVFLQPLAHFVPSSQLRKLGCRLQCIAKEKWIRLSQNTRRSPFYVSVNWYHCVGRLGAGMR
jgi:hypothetical protein